MRARVLAAVVGGLLCGSLLAACTTSPTGATVVAWFPSAISLYPNSDVKIMGLEAGKVRTVDPEGNRVRVELRMYEDVPLPVDVQATIVPVSLIGERYVQLMPAWTEGQPRAGARVEIPFERTSVPVEPDEALAAFKKLLDDLDPNATGRLIKNLGEDLEGQGEQFNRAIRGVSQLTSTLADKDGQIGGIIDSIDRLSTTLRTREAQLGRLIDDFARTAKLLADERLQIQQLIAGLARFGEGAYDLVAKHRVLLQKDLKQLQELLSALSTNLDHVDKLLSATPTIVAGADLDGRQEGLLAAYDPAHHLLDLRTNLSPLVSNLIGAILGSLIGTNTPPGSICLPVDVQCASDSAGGTKGVPAKAAPASAPKAPTTTASATVAPARTPIDGILGLLSAPSAAERGQRPSPAADREQGSWLRRTARRALGAVA